MFDSEVKNARGESQISVYLLSNYYLSESHSRKSSYIYHKTYEVVSSRQNNSMEGSGSATIK